MHDNDEESRLSAYAPHIAVRACGRLWRLERAVDLETLWNAMCDAPDASDERLPYWTELWPSTVALCDWLRERRADIAGRSCLDMGCGLGLASIVARWLGARVLGMDYEMEALRFARRNATVNAVDQPGWTVMDWRRPAVRKGAFTRIWGGDIMYERAFVSPVLRFLEHALAPDGTAWLAEPGRTVYDVFLQALSGGGCGVRWSGRPVFTRMVEPIYAQPVPVTVRVWEIRRA